MTQPETYDDDVLVLTEPNEDGCTFVACAIVDVATMTSNEVTASTTDLPMHAACWKAYDTAWKIVYADDWAAIEDTLRHRAERVGA